MTLFSSSSTPKLPRRDKTDAMILSILNLNADASIIGGSPGFSPHESVVNPILLIIPFQRP
jgi:hypothetical protein